MPIMHLNIYLGGREGTMIWPGDMNWDLTDAKPEIILPTQKVTCK